MHVLRSINDTQKSVPIGGRYEPVNNLLSWALAFPTKDSARGEIQRHRVIQAISQSNNEFQVCLESKKSSHLFVLAEREEVLQCSITQKASTNPLHKV